MPGTYSIANLYFGRDKKDSKDYFFLEGYLADTGEWHDLGSRLDPAKAALLIDKGRIPTVDSKQSHIYSTRRFGTESNRYAWHGLDEKQLAEFLQLVKSDD